jgi:hypothetical protein
MTVVHQLKNGRIFEIVDGTLVRFQQRDVATLRREANGWISHWETDVPKTHMTDDLKQDIQCLVNVLNGASEG